MRRSTIILLLASLLAVGATAAWRFVPRVLSYDECSPVYHHFVDMQLEGVRVTYIKDKLVGDTVRVPVTLLEAESDRGWELLDSLFGYSEEKNIILNDPEIPNNVKKSILENWPDFLMYLAHRETPEKNIEPHGKRPDDVMVYVQAYLRCVSIFEPANEVAEDKVWDNKFKEIETEDARRHERKAIFQQICKDLGWI